MNSHPGCDGQRTGSIKFNILNMLACGEQVKEMLSADTRIIINELRDYIRTVEVAYQNGLPELPEESLDNLVTSLLALSGLNHESMLRVWTGGSRRLAVVPNGHA